MNQTFDSLVAEVPIACFAAVAHWASWPGPPGATDCADAEGKRKKAKGKNRAAIVRIPYSLFWVLLKIYALFDKDPPFTTKQLEALVIPEEFELIPWWDIFGVPATPFTEAVRETFAGRYANVVLEF